MKKKQDDEFFDEYMQKRKNGCFYSEISSESLLITKIWDFNKTILEKWADINLLIAINEAKTNRKMKKGLKNIANNLREIAHKLDEAAEEKKCVDIVNENRDWSIDIIIYTENKFYGHYWNQKESEV